VESYAAYGLLYGVGFCNNRWLLSASTGLEYVDFQSQGSLLYIDSSINSTRNSIYEALHSRAVGLPYQLQVLYSFTEKKGIIGIGVIIYGDVNKIHTYDGYLFGIQIGWF